ncbi:uncharacterized protein LOC133033588 isoform X2 [Cannabis sativa]|uniref:uncharacterized protein LOC133033588 isoform X2 n=1 Tax=Cannabis sativa TaxID=3483 RepID=UPI0029CA0A03|nr:uncharacterized protein LOC133033588 isoform X2 [Cannabis sativa]
MVVVVPPNRYSGGLYFLSFSLSSLRSIFSYLCINESIYCSVYYYHYQLSHLIYECTIIYSFSSSISLFSVYYAPHLLSSVPLLLIFQPLQHHYTLGDCKMEADIWFSEVNRAIFIIVATPVEARDVTSEFSRRQLRGLWFFLYIVRLRLFQIEESLETLKVDMLDLHGLPAGVSLQLFTDAAIDTSRKRYSIGAVVMNSSNQVIAGFVKPFEGCVSPVIAKAKAILQALQWVTCIHLPVDVLKTDCKSIVDKISSSKRGCNVLDDFITCIRGLLSNCPLLSLSFVRRESNLLAHQVARWGLGLDSELIWNGSLPSI